MDLLCHHTGWGLVDKGEKAETEAVWKLVCFVCLSLEAVFFNKCIVFKIL